MALELTRVSSKGQVVIPRAIREELALKEGDRLLVLSRGRLLVMRRVEEEENVLATLAAPVRRKIAELDITRKEVGAALRRARRTGRPRAG